MALTAVIWNIALSLVGSVLINKLIGQGTIIKYARTWLSYVCIGSLLISTVLIKY